MDLRNNRDILQETIFSRVPPLLRWLLFLPLALLGAVVGSVLFILLNAVSGVDIDVGSFEGGWLRFAQSGILGFLFVFIGGAIIPRYQLIASGILIIILTVILTFLFTLGFVSEIDSTWYQVGHLITSIVGGVAAIFVLYDMIDNLPNIEPSSD